MILVREDISKKVPGTTSFFVQFNYNENLIVDIKTLSCYYYDKKSKQWEFPISELSSLIDILSKYDDITLNTFPEDAQEDIKYKIGPFKSKLFEHQLEAIQYGLNHNRWLLLDPPGLGKTATIIGLAQELKEKRNLSHCLVICGVNTLKSNWKSEISKHSNLSARILGERVNRKGKFVIDGVKKRIDQLKSPIDEFFVITNIESLRDDDLTELINEGPNKFDMIVVDEIHCAKSSSSQQGSNLLKLQKAEYRIGMTGTLIINNPIDCFTPFKWLGIEHCDNYIYKKHYCIMDDRFKKFIVGYKNLDYIREQIHDHSLRREKSMLNLPPLTVCHEYVDMNAKHQEFYNNLVDGILSDIDRVTIKKKTLLSIYTRLRQATACPSILTSLNIEASKIERAKSYVESIISNNEKIVVFSTFKATAEVLYDKLLQEGYKVRLCTGDTPDDDITQSIYLFQNTDEVDVLVCTWQKMGTGITLTAASYGLFIDTPQTAAQFEQARDRIYRIGTSKPVIITVLICKDTVDELVDQLLQNKDAISGYMLNDELCDRDIEILKKYILSL